MLFRWFLFLWNGVRLTDALDACVAAILRYPESQQTSQYSEIRPFTVWYFLFDMCQKVKMVSYTDDDYFICVF